MKSIDMRFDPCIFSSFLGKQFNGFRCDEFTYTKSVTQIIGMFIDDTAYRMTNIQEAVDYFGNPEDMAVCRFEECEDTDIQSAFVDGNLKDTPVDGIIERIAIVNENQRVYEGGVQTYDVWLTRGVIFTVDGRELSFEKENVPFSEEIIIRKGYDLLNEFGGTDDFSQEWDEGITAIATREVIVLE